jgi:hypothetical protein
MVALLGATLFLISPLSTSTLGTFLHHLTGRWGIDNYLGHMCALAAAGALLYHTLLRLYSDASFVRKCECNVSWPIRLAMPILFALFWCSNAGHQYHSMLLDAQPDGWLRAYIGLLCSMYVYLLGYGARAFLTLRHDRESRRTALIYFWGSVCSIAATIREGIFGVAGYGRIPRPPHLWMLICLCIALFAYSAGQSWRRQARQLRTTAPDDLVP